MMRKNLQSSNLPTLQSSLFGSVYRDKRVLITGHTGFKGSWLTLWLLELGAEVAGYSLEPPTEPNLFEILGLQEKITHIIGDVRDEQKLKYTFKEYKPEIVFHLAAQPLVRISYKEPKLTYETNVIGTVNLLEAVRDTESVGVVLNITSDKCYENKEWVYGYRENDPMGGYDPYSSSKGCAELVTSAYRKSFLNPEDYGKTHNVALASVRAGNVIGGGDWGEDRLIPDCIRALTKNEPIPIRYPKATRPWQYVLEPLSGYLWLGALMLANGKTYSDGWNFGQNTEDILTVEEVVKEVLSLWGEGKYRFNKESVLHEASLLKLDISKARSALRWRPVYGVKEAMEKTIFWYKKHYEEGSNDIYEYTANQIKDYINTAQSYNLEWCNTE